MKKSITAEIIIVGGGLAGLSAALYLARAKREVRVVDSGRSMARWEPDVENYLGFPGGIGGSELLQRGREQARRYQARFTRDEITGARRLQNVFRLRGRGGRRYECGRLLLATGIFHLPPDIPGIKPCLGHSMFFCKDCDGYRVQQKCIAIYGWSNETVSYALAMLFYSPCVAIVTDGRDPRWDRRHDRWAREYKIPIYRQKTAGIQRQGKQIRALVFADKTTLAIEALFTTRGDIFFNQLARDLGARINPEGEIVVDLDMRTTVRGLYAAGCVTPANCQMIIAAGQGATAAQAIDGDLLEESLANHSLRRFRGKQLAGKIVRPPVRRPG